MTFVPLHLVIKQVIMAQKNMLTMFIMNMVKLQMFTVLGVLFLCAYESSVLTTDTSNLMVQAVHFVPIVLYGNYSCASQKDFVNSIGHSPYAREGYGCPEDSGGISMTGGNCGFQTWEQACWRIGTVPAMNSVQYTVQMLSFALQVIPLGLSLLLYGRGIIKVNRFGGLDRTVMAFITKPRILTAFCLISIITLQTTLLFGEMFSNGAFLSSIVPTPIPIAPLSEFPSMCYGECVKFSYYGFMCLGAFGFCLIVAEASEIVTLPFCGWVLVDNRKIQARLAQGIESQEDLLDSNQQTILFEHLESTFGADVGGAGGAGGAGGGAHKENKFLGTKELVTGLVQEASEGLQSFLCVDDTTWNRIISSNGDDEIIREVERLRTTEEVITWKGGATNQDVIDLLHYIIHEPCSEKVFANGIRDKGRNKNMRLDDFLQDEHVEQAKLDRSHVIALRLYTTAAYNHINAPLRNRTRYQERIPHPLPATVYFITQGKFLSALSYLASTELKNCQMFSQFHLWLPKYTLGSKPTCTTHPPAPRSFLILTSPFSLALFLRY
jgi:hypothetical protein